MVNDEFADLLPFVNVVEVQSFRRAAERLGVTTAAVSKAITRLERRIGAPLLHRSSRHVAATPAGTLLFEHARQALGAVRSAREAIAGATQVVRGEVRVTLPLVMRSAVPRLAALAVEHPALSVRVLLTDRMVSLEREEVDVAVRIGRLEPTSLVRRPLRPARWLTVASPSYLARRGRPAHPSELAAHDCVKFVLPTGAVREWSFRVDGRVKPFATGTLLEADDGFALLEAALAGIGVSQVFDFMIDDALREGRLVEVLSDFEPPGPPVHALCTRAKRTSPNVRAVLGVVERLWARR